MESVAVYFTGASRAFFLLLDESVAAVSATAVSPKVIMVSRLTADVSIRAAAVSVGAVVLPLLAAVVSLPIEELSFLLTAVTLFACALPDVSGFTAGAIVSAMLSPVSGVPYGEAMPCAGLMPQTESITAVTIAVIIDVFFFKTGYSKNVLPSQFAKLRISANSLLYVIHFKRNSQS